MANKAHEVYLLVEDVLRTIQPPYGEDILDDVCLAIEQNRQWRQRYDELCADLSKDTVNKWIGQYAKRLTGMQTQRGVAARRATIISAYSKLRA